MAKTLELFYDFGSPYSYLASTQVEAVCQRHGAVLAWRPMLLGGLFKAVGSVAPALAVAAKMPYLMVDLQRWADHYGIPIAMNPNFPMNSLTAMRMAVAADERGHQVPFLKRVFAAAWAEGADIGDPATLVRLADEAGAPGAALLERASAGHVKEGLKANTEEAVRRGAFGAPTFFVGDEMFFGNDRLSFVEKALEASA
jgi:2-hydroxychromene-2-carboxylate isomerase